jgi:hypothetical protein
MKKKSKPVSSATQTKLLKEKYGTSMNWVDVTLPMTYHEMEEHFGPMCEEFEPLCACCRAWVQWHTSEQRVTVSLERNAVLKIMN